LPWLTDAAEELGLGWRLESLQIEVGVYIELPPVTMNGWDEAFRCKYPVTFEDLLFYADSEYFEILHKEPDWFFPWHPHCSYGPSGQGPGHGVSYGIFCLGGYEEDMYDAFDRKDGLLLLAMAITVTNTYDGNGYRDLVVPKEEIMRLTMLRRQP